MSFCQNLKNESRQMKDILIRYCEKIVLPNTLDFLKNRGILEFKNEEEKFEDNKNAFKEEIPQKKKKPSKQNSFKNLLKLVKNAKTLARPLGKSLSFSNSNSKKMEDYLIEKRQIKSMEYLQNEEALEKFYENAVINLPFDEVLKVTEWNYEGKNKEKKKKKNRKS
jgi:hypothetical protein